MSFRTIVMGLVLTLGVSGAFGQSLSERIAAVKEQRQRSAEQNAEAERPPSQQIPSKLSQVIDEVLLDDAAASEAFNWWSTRTGIPLVIDWQAMELDGINPDTGITLDLRTVPARILLELIMRQASPDVDLIYEVTPWYIEIMTKRQANMRPVLRVYDVSDMVMRIPNFTNAPRLDLNEALSNTNSGGSGGTGGGGGSSGLFTDEDETEEDVPTKQENGEDLADLIRNTIEPEIWQANGGAYASVRYYDGRLIVNAPMYVHQQIGIPQVRAYRPRVTTRGDGVGATAPPSASKPFGVRPD